MRSEIESNPDMSQTNIDLSFLLNPKSKGPSGIQKISVSALDWLFVAFILIIAFLFRFPLILPRETLLPGDEVMFGLMGKHILQGQLPVFYWGQGYLGTIEAYVTAILSLFMGMNGFTVQMGGFFFYELFIAVNYFVTKRIFGFRTAVFASVFLLVPPVMMTELSVRALGGYSEILFIGALSLLFWLKVFQDGNRNFLIPLGLTLGFGLWTNTLFVIYLAAFALMTFFWKDGFNDRARDFNPVRITFLKNFNIPLWLKIPFYAIHLIVLFYIVQQLFIFFHGGLDHKILGIKFQEPAFQWKGVKKILLLLSGEAAALSFLVIGWRNILIWLKQWTGFIAAFLIGYAPAMLYGLFGGEGYRLLHKSGAVQASALGTKFQTIFLNLLPNALWGLNFDSHYSEIVHWGSLFILGLFVLGLVYLVWSNRESIRNVFIFRDGIQHPAFFFCVLGVCVLAMTFASALVADRYLTPFYWVTAVSAGALLASLSRRTWGVGALLLIPYLLFQFGSFHAYIGTLKKEEVKSLISFLKEKGIQGGVTDYDNSFRFNFYSNEDVIFVPREGMMRHPQYRKFVSGLKEFAFILPADSTNEKDFLAANPNFNPSQTYTHKGYRVYIVDPSFPIPPFK